MPINFPPPGVGPPAVAQHTYPRKISAGGHPYLAHEHEAAQSAADRKVSIRYISTVHFPEIKSNPNLLLRRCVRSASFGGCDLCHPLQSKDQLDSADQVFQLMSTVKPCVAPADAGDASFQRALACNAARAAPPDPVAANLSDHFHAVFSADLTQSELQYRERYPQRRRSWGADVMQVRRVAEIKKERGAALLERLLWERNQFFGAGAGYAYRAIDEPTLMTYLRADRIDDPRIEPWIGISRRLNGTYFSTEYSEELAQHWRRHQMPPELLGRGGQLFLLRVPIRDLLLKGFPKDHWNTGACAEPLTVSLHEYGEGGAFQCLASTREFKREYIWKVRAGARWADPAPFCLNRLVARNGRSVRLDRSAMHPSALTD